MDWRIFILSLFDWDFEERQTQGYHMIKNAGSSGALMHIENPQQVYTQFVNVESLEEHITKARY